MTENLERDSYRINEFILNAALKKQPVFEAYQRLCEIEGNRKLDYVDFEWKYYQYYHGNRDLTIERSSENSSPLTFSVVPIDNLKKVVGELDLRDCLRLRKVSHDLRNLVDCTEIHCGRIKFDFSYFPSMIVGNVSIKYCEDDDGNFEISVNHSRPKPHHYNVDQTPHTAMLADACAILQNPKLKIGCLEILVFDEEEFPEFVEFPNSLNFQLNVRSFHFTTFTQSPLPILKLLKAKALEEIKLDTRAYTMRQVGNQFDGIEETEQWKMAKKLCCDSIPDGFSMEKMLHFKEIRINGFELSDNNLIMIRDILLKSVHLESCSLEANVVRWVNNYDSDDDDDDGERGVHEENINRVMSEHPAFDPKTRRIPIPNSPEHFQLEYGNFGYTNNLVIKRTTDKRRIEEFIRDSARFKRSVYSSYKLLCELEENLVMDYVEFEWRYYQYYHGNQSIERSPNNSSFLTLSDLPKNALEKVADKLDLPTCLRLRKVSRSLRSLVDESKEYRVDVSVDFDSKTLDLGNCRIRYSQLDEGRVLVTEQLRPYRKAPRSKELNTTRDVTEMITTDVTTMLKNPNLKIGELTVCIRERNDAIDGFLGFLEALKFRIQVERIHIKSENWVGWIRQILKCLEPETLKKINLATDSLEDSQFKEIMDLEQWKKAEIFESRGFPHNCSIENLFHFESIQIDEIEMNKERLLKIRDILLKSSHFENLKLDSWTFKVSHTEGDGTCGIPDVLRIMSQDPRFDPETRRFSIPNSEKYLQLDFDQCSGKSLGIKKIPEKLYFTKEEEIEEDDEEDFRFSPDSSDYDDYYDSDLSF